jgi:hypothetical protein
MHDEFYAVNPTAYSHEKKLFLSGLKAVTKTEWTM